MGVVGRLIKFLAIALVVGGLLFAASYAGARFKVGQILGPSPPDMGTRTISFGNDSVPGQGGRRLVWTFSWSPTPWTGTRPVRIWISATGDVLYVWPRNLEALVERYYQSKEEI